MASASRLAAARGEITERVREFYEETPFPNYDELDSVATLAEKARKGIFARLLDEQLAPGIRILECGCGTGQLAIFLSLANRNVFASDLCMNSLRLGQAFAREHRLSRVHFLEMNLFRPAFQPESFDLVICNGVLHHTADPPGAFKSIAKLVRMGGHVIIGLYHKYGRWITDLRRLVFRLSGDRFLWLDPNLRNPRLSAAKRRAWLADQYQHPHESKHTIGEVLGWLEAAGFSFVRSIPSSKPFRPFPGAQGLFEREEPGNAVERFLAGLELMAKGSREGGFFTVIARRG